MPIAMEKVVVARCDAPKCKAIRYGSEAIPAVGFYAEVEQVIDSPDGTVGNKAKIFACSTPHLNKAVVHALTESPTAFQTVYSRTDDDKTAETETES